MKVFIDYLISWNFDTKGALVTAPCGTGKTHALVSFFKKLELITPSVMFVTLQDLLSAIRSEMLENKEYMLDKALKSKILIIDDFGVEKQTEWVIDTFYKIINERYNNNLPVFISTNLNVKEIKDYFGERVLSRLYGMCNFFTFKGKDFRREVK
jgi:DNA replication protein DnaC